uniref:Telomerase reverse transcriptase n=1 Tax=Trichobilharzia regenti TaxID=157069 RepID=A0AA85JG79_TRIRE|nr:unnamed protein product [Trichobilharzia regenti]
MTTCYRDRSSFKDSNFMLHFFDALKRFTNMFSVHIQLILAEINVEELRNMMKCSKRYKKMAIRYNEQVNHRYVPKEKATIWRPYIYALVYTLLSGIVVFYLKRYFCWCEFNATVPTVAYFVRDKWKTISKSFVNELVKDGVIQVVNNSVTPLSSIHLHEYTGKRYSITHSVGRLSMKSSGNIFRLVTNASYQLPNNEAINLKKCQSTVNCLSLNQRLKLQNGLFDVFKRLQNEFPNIYAPSLLSTKSAFTALLSFRSFAYSVGFRRFWIAKVDIQDCFNQIVHSRLLEICSNVFDEVSFYMYPEPDVQFLKRELEWFLKESTMSIDGNLYSFVKGIPQGSCISSDLANIYLSRLDRELYTKQLLWSPYKSLRNPVFETNNYALKKCATFFRYLDDYLCISTSKNDLQNLLSTLQSGLKSYELYSNQKKSQDNLHNSNTPVSWLGIEVHCNLAITLPKSNPLIFCRFAGQPLSASKCIRRICKFRLHRSTWRFTFYNINYHSQIKRNIFDLAIVNAKRNDRLLRVNAVRLGNWIADIIWISFKTSPEKDRLTQPSVCRQLATAAFKCICVNIGFGRVHLHRLALNAVVRRLLPHNGELNWLIVWIQHFIVKK